MRDRPLTLAELLGRRLLGCRHFGWCAKRSGRGIGSAWWLSRLVGGVEGYGDGVSNCKCAVAAKLRSAIGFSPPSLSSTCLGCPPALPACRDGAEEQAEIGRRDCLLRATLLVSGPCICHQSQTPAARQLQFHTSPSIRTSLPFHLSIHFRCHHVHRSSHHLQGRQMRT